MEVSEDNAGWAMKYGVNTMVDYARGESNGLCFPAFMNGALTE
jgi:hypothetical protein